jgi:hypothetical protein
MSYGPAGVIGNPDTSFPRAVDGLGPGESSSNSYTPFEVASRPHMPGAVGRAEATTFAGSGPTAANSTLTNHWAADIEDHEAGDFGLDEIVFQWQETSEAGSGLTLNDPRMQSTKTKGLTALNYMMNDESQSLAWKLSSMTVAQAAQVARFKGILGNEERTAIDQGSEKAAALVAVIKGRAYFPNIALATAQKAVMEGSSIWLVFVRMRRRPLTSVTGDFVTYDAAPRELTKAESAALERNAAIKQRRAAGPNMDYPRRLCDSDEEFAQRNAMLPAQFKREEMTTEDLCPSSIWDEMCGSTPTGSSPPLYTHLWLPFHSPDGMPPDAALYGKGVPVYLCHVQASMRGENVPTQAQIIAARKVVFPTSRNQEYRKDFAKIDQICGMLRMRQMHR